MHTVSTFNPVPSTSVPSILCSSQLRRYSPHESRTTSSPSSSNCHRGMNASLHDPTHDLRWSYPSLCMVQIQPFIFLHSFYDFLLPSTLICDTHPAFSPLSRPKHATLPSYSCLPLSLPSPPLSSEHWSSIFLDVDDGIRMKCHNSYSSEVG